jgi:hypothetical protein
MFILFIMLIGGTLSAAIASSKGRSGVMWFMLGALLPLPGLIAACCVKGEPKPDLPPDMRL